ncbi:glycosyltransferase [Allomuricauda sp. R78024]|uniref:glycosyltransferase n=1 Tax=Allomuricauda sp. R78024 TaxID=3093867 RepID=UPI0037C56A98
MKLKKDIDWLTIVTHDANGGAEQTQKNLISYLLEEGKICHVIILRKKHVSFWNDLEDKCKIVYFPFPSHSVGYLCLLPYLIWLKSKNNISYIFSSQTLINGLVGGYKRFGILKKSKIIVRESTSIFQRSLNFLNKRKYLLAYKLGYPGADLVICQTDFMKKELIKNLSSLEKKVKIEVISNPINHKEIRLKALEVIPSLETDNYMVTAGRLIPEKGYDLLIDAYQKVHSKLEGHKLFILGKGPEEENLRTRINTLGLENQIFLKGSVPNVYPYFKNARLCVMSSRVEGFPNVLLQMMSQNENVVSTLSAGDIGEIPCIYTSPVNDTEQLASTILECYKSDNSGKRKVMNQFLKKRGLDVFIKTIENHVV